MTTTTAPAIRPMLMSRKQIAKIIDVGPDSVARILRARGVREIRLGHRTVRYAVEDVEHALGIGSAAKDAGGGRSALR